MPGETARWFDPADTRFEGTITFTDDTPTIQFLRARLLATFTHQPRVKHLVCVEEGTTYHRYISGDDIVVHGDCRYIYAGIIHLPLNQAIPEKTRYALSCNNREGTHAVTMLSDQLKPDGGESEAGSGAKTASRPTIIPFNRRALLLHVMPGEQLDARYIVSTSDNFSVHEMTHFRFETTAPKSAPVDGPLAGPVSIRAFVFGTQLGTKPAELLRRIVGHCREMLRGRINNEFDTLAVRAGFTDIDRLRTSFIEFLDELDACCA